VAIEAATRKKPRRERTQRVDWAELLRRTFAVEVFACVRCGGRRRVLAGREGSSRGARFWSIWGCPRRVRACPRCESPLRLRGVEAQDSQEAQDPCRAPPGRAAWAGVYPKASPASSLGVGSAQSGGQPLLEAAGIEPVNKAIENPKQDALLPAIALILLGFVIPSRPTPCPRVPPLSPLAGHTGGT
jgi:hypothetical protein